MNLKFLFPTDGLGLHVSLGPMAQQDKQMRTSTFYAIEVASEQFFVGKVQQVRLEDQKACSQQAEDCKI